MKRLIRAELLKLRTTRLFLFSFAAVPVLAGLVVLAVYSAAGRQGNDPLGADSLMHAVGAQASVVTTIALLLGVIGLAGEYRHQTITTTLLAAPRRRDVVAAKVAVHALLGGAMALMSMVTASAVAVPWLLNAGVSLEVDSELARVAAGLLVSATLHGALGVSVAALLRNQTAAVTIVLVWLLKGEGLLAGVLAPSWIGDWMPVALGSVLHAGVSGPSPWAAAAALCAYVVAFAAVGARLVVSRDVT